MPRSILAKARWWRAGRQALVVLLASIAVLPNLSAAAAPAQAGAGDDLRAAFATPQDIAEGKRVALASCASCHALTGIALARGTPHIAGQRPAYLYAELRVYQAGRRGNTPMNNAVKFLSDDALVKVAAYYASLDPAPPAAASARKASKADPLSAGKDAAAGCSGCHGDDGISETPGMPNLVGLDAKYIGDATRAYKTGQRKHGMMKTLVSALSEAEIDSISLFYAMQKPGKAKTPAPGNKAAGKDCRHRVRELSWPGRRKHRHGPKSRRSGRAVLRRGNEGLQDRSEGRRGHESASGIAGRHGHQGPGGVLCRPDASATQGQKAHDNG